MFLATQDQAYKGALDIMLRQVLVEINSLNPTVSELKRSLEFSQSEIDDLMKTKIVKLERERAADKGIIQNLKN